MLSAWKRQTNDRSAIASIMSGARELSNTFENFDFCYSSRDANCVVHVCAKSACEQMIPVEWRAMCPRFLLASLQADCIMLSSNQ